VRSGVEERVARNWLKTQPPAQPPEAVLFYLSWAVVSGRPVRFRDIPDGPGPVCCQHETVRTRARRSHLPQGRASLLGAFKVPRLRPITKDEPDSHGVPIRPVSFTGPRSPPCVSFRRRPVPPPRRRFCFRSAPARSQFRTTEHVCTSPTRRAAPRAPRTPA
jgi:hypothetical protein